MNKSKFTSTRPIRDIIGDHVTVISGHIGVTLSDNVPPGEFLLILDWLTTLSDHCGFMLGDALNFGQAKWREEYIVALNRRGLVGDELHRWATMADLIPLDQREAWLEKNVSDVDSE